MVGPVTGVSSGSTDTLQSKALRALGHDSSPRYSQSTAPPPCDGDSATHLSHVDDASFVKITVGAGANARTSS